MDTQYDCIRAYYDYSTDQFVVYGFIDVVNAGVVEVYDTDTDEFLGTLEDINTDMIASLNDDDWVDFVLGMEYDIIPEHN